MTMLFGTQVADQTNEHQRSLRAARFDGVASPVPVSKSLCFEARSAREGNRVFILELFPSVRASGFLVFDSAQCHLWSLPVGV